MEELAQSNQPDETAIILDGVEGEAPPVTVPDDKPFYSAEDLAALHPTEIDLERVNPDARPIVEKTIKEYKSLQGDYTRKSQELAEIKKAVPAPAEKFFDDGTKDSVFRDYLKTPMKVLGDINGEIAKLEAVVPDDGTEVYRNARRTIAQWQAIKDEFREKKAELSVRTQQEEVAEAKLIAELGKDAPALLEHAKELGFSEKDFKTKPGVREVVKKTYKLSHAVESASGKEVKPVPHKAATPAGGASGMEEKPVVFKDDNEWFKNQQQQKKEAIKRRLGG